MHRDVYRNVLLARQQLGAILSCRKQFCAYRLEHGTSSAPVTRTLKIVDMQSLCAFHLRC